MGQDSLKKGGAVPITFVPPPMENATYSIGIYDVKTGKLARRLCEAAGQDTFKVGLNGLITSWDGKDDDGQALPPGKYAARGYAVGPLEVEGVAVLGNDWAEDNDKLRLVDIDFISLLREDNGLEVLGTNGSGQEQAARYGGEKHGFLSQKILANAAVEGGGPPDPQGVVGRNNTRWKIEEGVLSQYSARGERLRVLAPKATEPPPVAVTASPDADCIYLLEKMKGWQRVRGLSWVETKEESGKSVSTWQTFFERNIRTPNPSTGLEDAATAKAPSPSVEIALEDNPLAPGKREHVKLLATFDAKGSYVATADGLRLRQISQREHLRAVKLAKGDTSATLGFFQTDGAAWDEFSIKGTSGMVAFDAGEFEIDAAGEKPVAEKAPEPDL